MIWMNHMLTSVSILTDLMDGIGVFQLLGQFDETFRPVKLS
jgi:hypothetical protein